MGTPLRANPSHTNFTLCKGKDNIPGTIRHESLDGDLKSKGDLDWLQKMMHPRYGIRNATGAAGFARSLGDSLESTYLRRVRSTIEAISSITPSRLARPNAFNGGREK